MPEFYSQFGEDEILSRLFADTPVGTCLDVGANDGVTFSNSYYFEQLGWHCVLVEPNPALCQKIRAFRKGLLFECAASDRDGEAILNFHEGANLYGHLGAPSVGQHGIAVKTRRLDDLLEEAGIKKLDFLSIDVEGHEISALGGLTIDRWAPRIVLLEDDSDLQDTPVCRFMRNHGYTRFYRTGGNDWYAAPENTELSRLSKLLGSHQWRFAGLAKAWLPASVRGPATNILRGLRRSLK